MPRSTLAAEGLPAKVLGALKKLGADLRTARQRRAMTQAVMARNMYVTEKTVRRVEAGDPGVSLGVYASALFVLGLSDRLGQIASPETDAYANWQQRQAAPKRVREKGTRSDGLDF